MVGGHAVGEETLHVVAMGPGLATILSRDSEFRHDSPKQSLARVASEILEDAKQIAPKELGDADGPRIYAVDVTTHRSAEDKTTVTVWAEQLGDTNQATVFLPSER